MRQKLITIIISILLLFGILISINMMNINENRNNISSTLPSWTVMVYISGDNWLTEMATKNLGLLKSVGSTKDVNIIVLLDEKGENNTRFGYIKLREFNESLLSELNPKYNDELNLGINKTLEDFAIWCMTNYPAEHYLLDIWGHGKGWRGVALDGEDYLTMAELDSALKIISEFNNGKKLDVLGFDACAMSMVEVYYEIKDYANIVIASEKDIPERGWPYYNILEYLIENPVITPRDLSILIVEEYTEAYGSGKIDNEGLSVALAAVDLEKIEPIVEALEFNTLERSELINYEQPDYVDLYKYGEINKLQELMIAINNSIIKEDHWSNPDGESIQYAFGMTIYYPKQYDEEYEKLKFAKDTNWDESLKDHFF